MDHKTAAAQLRAIADWLEKLEAKPTTPQAKGQLLDEAAFYDALRDGKMLGPKISQSEFQGLNALLRAGEGLPIMHLAYVLATAYHETASTMQPIDEYGGDSYFTRNYDVQGRDPERARKMGNTEPGDGIKYHGRGFVQLTWKDNYARAGKALGVDLVAKPELAKDLEIAANICVMGMMNGWFTGKKLADFTNFFDMRKVVNGTDKSDLIANYARDFMSALQAGGYQ